jgi:hypothetical protein
MHAICTLINYRKIIQTVQAPGNIGKTTGEDERKAVLQKAFPLAFDGSDVDEEKNAEDYPFVRFWTKSQFDPTSFKNTDMPSFGTRLYFLKDELGLRISQERLDNMWADLVSSFKEIKKKIPSIHGESWTQIDRDIQDACSLHLTRRFPELTLCVRNWKFQSLMVEWFANWNRDRKSGKAKIKKEENNGEGTSSSTTIPAKRNIEVMSSPLQTKKRRQAPPAVIELCYVLWLTLSLTQFPSGTMTSMQMINPPLEICY